MDSIWFGTIKTSDHHSMTATGHFALLSAKPRVRFGVRVPTIIVTDSAGRIVKRVEETDAKIEVEIEQVFSR